MSSRDLRYIDGDVDFGAVVESDELLRQRIAIALRTQLGDWPFDLSWGLPWLQRILIANASLGEISASLRALLSRIPGVERVGDISLYREGRTLHGTIFVNGVIEVEL